jgi:hypothetical protein
VIIVISSGLAHAYCHGLKIPSRVRRTDLLSVPYFQVTMRRKERPSGQGSPKREREARLKR